MPWHSKTVRLKKRQKQRNDNNNNSFVALWNLLSGNFQKAMSASYFLISRKTYQEQLTFNIFNPYVV